MSTASPRRLSAIEVAVLVSGTTSMGLEILAGRLVAPVYGSSIYTWGSIIGVFLAALSLGYHRGGKRAREHTTTNDIAVVLLGAALYVAFMLFAHEYLLTLSRALPIPARYGSLLPVAVLFAPPVYLLGYITPIAAHHSDLETTGEASGRVFAIGTVGSILGAFMTTFLLIPLLDVDVIGVTFGVALLAAAFWVRYPGVTRRETAIALVVLVSLVAAVSFGGPSLTGDVVYETQTAYQELAVVDDNGVRTLYLDGQRHSAMALDDTDGHVFSYTRYFHLAFLFSEDVDNVLFIGGGGFTGPKAFATQTNASIDVVEIDPVVVDAAKTYFDVEETDQVDIHVADGRSFLQNTEKTYDVIIVDAYRRDKVPFHLTTAEFMALTEDRLDTDGVLLLNVISTPTGSGSQFFRAEMKTVETAYPQVYAFRTSSTGFVQNIEVVATKSDLRLSQAELAARSDTRDVGVPLDDAIDLYASDVSTRNVPVLVDDNAPVSRLIDPLAGQRYVIESTRNVTA